MAAATAEPGCLGCRVEAAEDPADPGDRGAEVFELLDAVVDERENLARRRRVLHPLVECGADFDEVRGELGQVGRADDAEGGERLGEGGHAGRDDVDRLDELAEQALQHAPAEGALERGGEGTGLPTDRVRRGTEPGLHGREGALDKVDDRLLGLCPEIAADGVAHGLPRGEERGELGLGVAEGDTERGDAGGRADGDRGQGQAHVGDFEQVAAEDDRPCRRHEERRGEAADAEADAADLADVLVDVAQGVVEVADQAGRDPRARELHERGVGLGDRGIPHLGEDADLAGACEERDLCPGDVGRRLHDHVDIATVVLVDELLDVELGLGRLGRDL
jgi:hypothetical protein